MVRPQPSNLFVAGIILLCTIYWLYKLSAASDTYTDTQYLPDEDKRMLQADHGGSRVRFVHSHSAGQYDAHEADPMDEVAQKLVVETMNKLYNLHQDIKADLVNS